MGKQYKTIEFDDRKTIAVMYGDGARAADIADRIGVSRTAVYAGRPMTPIWPRSGSRKDFGGAAVSRKEVDRMSETCGRCGRRLKNPAYIEIGYGRKCAAKLGIEIPRK